MINPLDFIMHLDKHLQAIVQYFGAGTYFVLFGIVFAETGLVFTPFLPGDSLLFVVGAFSAKGVFEPVLMCGLLFLAAVLGDSVNYAIGKYFGRRLVGAKHLPFFNKEHLDKAHNFYKKYGGKTIILARFLPVVRTFAPFVAGLARMDYGKFFIYNVAGGAVWVGLFFCGGFYFGNIPFIKKHFSEVIMVIIVVSILPGVFEFLKARKSNRKINA